MNEAMTHLTLGAVIVYSIEWLKAQGWCSWMTADSKTINRLVSLAASLVVAAGISYRGDVMHGGTITIPPLVNLLNGCWDALKQFMANQVLYDAVTRKPVVIVQASTALPPGIGV